MASEALGQQAFEIGSELKSKTGEVGTLLDIVQRDGVDYARIKFPDYESFVKADVLEKRFTPASRSESVVSATEQVADEVQALYRYIKAHQTYTAETFASEPLTAQQTEVLEGVLGEARANNYLFRADLRHPLARGKFDREEGRRIGPFREGFKATGAGYDGRVYFTADPSTALLYPSPEDAPRDWDGSSYIYLVSPQTIIHNPKQIKAGDLRNNEVGVPFDIPPQDVKYAFQMKSTKRFPFTIKVANIYKNESNKAPSMTIKK